MLCPGGMQSGTLRVLLISYFCLSHGLLPRLDPFGCTLLCSGQRTGRISNSTRVTPIEFPMPRRENAGDERISRTSAVNRPNRVRLHIFSRAVRGLNVCAPFSEFETLASIPF
jgi:hypothetical protein